MNIRRIQLLSCLGLAAVMLFWLDPEPTAGTVVGIVAVALLFACGCRQPAARRGLAIGNLALIVGLSLIRIPLHPDLLALYIGVTLWCILLVLEIWQLSIREETGARLHRQRLTASLSALLGLIPFWYGLRLANDPTSAALAGWILGGLGLLVCFGGWLTIAGGRFQHGVLHPGFALWLGLLLGSALFAATAVTQTPLGAGDWRLRLQEWLPDSSAAGKTSRPPDKREPDAVALDLGNVPEAMKNDRTPQAFLVFDSSVQDQLLRRPFYLRRAAYDSFTGRRWTHSEKSFDWFEDPDDGNEDGWIAVGDRAPSRTITHGVFIPRQASHEMLSLPNPVAVGVPVLMRGPNDSFLIPAREGQDVAYAVTSSWSTYKETAATNPAFGNPGAGYLQLPDSAIVDRLRADATHLVQGQRSARDRIEALFTHMQRTYRYGVDARGAGSLARFVAGEAPGHCTLHATVFAILLRAQGIPARVARGYYGGCLDRAAGVYFFTNADRHAWTEVYFEDHGWVIIDATPAGPRGPSEVADSGFGETVAGFSFLGSPRVEQSGKTTGSGFWFWSAENRSQFAQQGWAGFVLALVLGSGLLIGWLWQQWRQRTTTAAAPPLPAAAAPDYFQAFCRAGAKAGRPKQAAQTPREYLQMLKAEAIIGTEFDSLVEYLYATRYAGQPRSAARESEFRKQVKTATPRKPRTLAAASG